MDEVYQYILTRFKPNGLFHPYYLEKFILHFRGVRLIFLRFSFKQTVKTVMRPCINNSGPDETPHYAASHLGLHCLPMSQL